MAVLAIHFAKDILGTTGNSLLIALLVLPLLLYGAVSGRLAEFTAPGGWVAKFREVAERPVYLTGSRVKVDDLPEPRRFQKKTWTLCGSRSNVARFHEGNPIVLTLTLAGNYVSYVLSDYIRKLSRQFEFKFLAVKNMSGRIVVYIPARVLWSAGEARMHW